MPNVELEVLKSRLVLTRLQQLFLIESFSATNFHQPLKSIRYSKASGEDGFNSYLFKQA